MGWHISWGVGAAWCEHERVNSQAVATTSSGALLNCSVRAFGSFLEYLESS